MPPVGQKIRSGRGPCQAFSSAAPPTASAGNSFCTRKPSSAARMASEDPESCAIAGEAAAQLYGLNILAPNIEDDPNNTTRFLVIADHDAGPSGQDRTSLVFSTPNRPGAIHGLLEPLARHGVDLTKLQSRPARSGLWEYVFYADVNGHREDAQVAAALQELNERAAFVKIIGSYPVAAI